jgi:glycosyltransferase involved in cell wall biosynthesis
MVPFPTDGAYLMRVAFMLIGGEKWTGGRNYLLNLFKVLSCHQQGRITPVMFADARCAADEFAAFSAIPGVEVIQTPLMNTSRRTAEIACALLFGRDLGVQRLFKAARIDVVFEAARFFGWRLGIPAIAWLPDFQHKAMPQLFSRRAWWKREVGIRVQLFAGRTVMLSSETSRLECERYYRSARGRTRSVRFAVPPGEGTSLAEARAVAKLYELPEHFFFLPNQFWQHKNHHLVVDALVILRQKGKKVVVAASGNQHDPRVPEYFPAFRHRLESLGLRDEFRLLGMIPYGHLAPLMVASVALVNPSLCEGWSTTVEEGKSTGTPMLLSDLAVHREQMGAEAVYFDRHSAQSLADALDSFAPLNVQQRTRRLAAARQAAERRVEKFAQEFIECCEFSQTRHARVRTGVTA